jgi:hypothetical protein
MNAIYLQGLINDFKRSYVHRRNKNFDPGSGRSLQTTQALTLRNRRPAANSIGKFLFISKERRGEDGETARQIIKEFLKEKAEQHGGKLHADGDEQAINAIVNQEAPSQKQGYNIATRPLFSYSERNADNKKCKYGAYRDGSRYRCAQNLNHKKGGGGDVTRQTSEKRDDGYPDQRTKQQNRAVNVPAYVQRRPVRAANQPDADATYEQNTEPIRAKKRSNREATALVDALAPKNLPAKRNRK